MRKGLSKKATQFLAKVRDAVLYPINFPIIDTDLSKEQNNVLSHQENDLFNWQWF